MSEACIHDRFTDCDRGCKKCVRYVPRYECDYCGADSRAVDVYKINDGYFCVDCLEFVRDEDALYDFLEDPDIMTKYCEHLQEYFSDCLIKGDSE